MELIIMQFSPSSCHVIPPWLKYSPMYHVLKHPPQSLNARHPPKITKVIVLLHLRGVAFN